MRTVQRKMNEMLKGPSGDSGSALAGVLGSSKPFALDIDVNDSPRKGMLTRKQTHEEIAKSTGVNILVRGRYRPPGDLTTTDRPLHLHIEADDQESLDKAHERVKQLMGEAAVAEGAGNGAAAHEDANAEASLPPTSAPTPPPLPPASMGLAPLDSSGPPMSAAQPPPFPMGNPPPRGPRADPHGPCRCTIEVCILPS